MTESDQSQSTVTEAESGTDASEKAAPLGISVEEIGAGRKRLKIEIPEQRIAAKLESSFAQLNSDAMIPGFRRGRAPRRLIERRFSTSVREDACGELISEAFSEAVESESLRIVGEPDIKDQDALALPESGSLAFEAEVEVIPHIDLPDLEGIALNRYRFDVTDEQIDKAIERFCTRFGSYKDVADGAIQANDWILAQAQVHAGHDAADDAEPIIDVPAAPIFLPPDDADDNGYVAGFAIEKLREKVEGKKAGDTMTAKITGPPMHENESVRDAPVTISARIDRVERNEPCSLDELVKHFGHETEEQLRTQLRETMEAEAERDRASNLRDQAGDHLLEAVSLELPEGLTGRQAERLLQRRSLQLASSGMSEEQVEKETAKARSESQRDAIRHLKLFFILNEAAEKMEIEVSTDEVNGQIAVMARDRGQRPEKLRQEMQRNGELEHLYVLLRETKTLTSVVEKAEVTDVDEPPPTPDGA